MPIVAKESMLLSLKNIASFGDTDIFPFPNENHLFHDRPEDVVSVLNEIDNDFRASISRMPVLTSKELAVVGYGISPRNANRPDMERISSLSCY
jgi:hypothetical protein